ncbi:MAG: hypothetical protein ACO32H_07525, partial [Steroidobacteraceae bacterium]
HRLAVGLSVTESLCHRALRLIEGEQVTTLDEVILRNAFAVFGGVSHLKCEGAQRNIDLEPNSIAYSTVFANPTAFMGAPMIQRSA